MGLQSNFQLRICLIVCALTIGGNSDPTYSRIRSPPSTGRTRHEYLVAPPPEKAFHRPHHSSNKVYHPRNFMKHPSIAIVPSASPFEPRVKKWGYGPASAPFTHFHKHHHHHHTRKKFGNPALEPSHPINSPTYRQQGPPVLVPRSSFSMPSRVSLAPAPAPSSKNHFTSYSPMSSSKKTMAPPPFSAMTLPPPPPNEDCGPITCTEPLTYTPPGALCACVWPVQVKLRIGIAIYKFFPLVSELAQEIAASVQLNHSQVRIMGANSQELEKSTVLIDLVPLEMKFDHTASLSIYKKFWNRQLYIKASLFGPYEIVYVRYPGLPPSPPSVDSRISSIDDGPYSGQDNNGQAIKPLGVAIPTVTRKRNGLRGSIITLIVISSFTAFVLCLGIIWFLVLKCGTCAQESEQRSHSSKSFLIKPSGNGSTLRGSSISRSASILSVSSGALTFTGAAKCFTLNDIKKATNCFDALRVIGEGGFGIVYRGILDEGVEVAVKVLKRVDQRGGREFLSEVEMLSRLHHRNLVKLIGICTEDNARCLVYELVPNGSLESHLHGVDKGSAPLDWVARMKIALGAARGLAYLHEDSSPRVIHRDFKASNILLEHDFTPKVSDFGLARAALDEGNKSISTHVMGTFGYLAPEYAMTGHLLVKSDVYSYGVVLLELLTGRKPVDLSQPPAQENLVAWARPLLTSKEGLEAVIDPAIKSNVSLDSVAKVAAIASMCVQAEVTHRPFMGEVVQALKLVCNELDNKKDVEASKRCSEVYRVSSELMEASETCHTISAFGSCHGSNVAVSEAVFTSISPGIEEEESGNLRRNFNLEPLRIGR